MPRNRAEQIYRKMIAICERHRETEWIRKAAELSYGCGKMLAGGSCDSRSQWRVEQLQRAAWLMMRASQKYRELVKENPALLPPLAQACFDAAVLLEKLHLSGPANGAWQHCLDALVKIREHQKTSCDDAARSLEGGLRAVLSGCMHNADRMLQHGRIQESATLRETLARFEGGAGMQGQPG